MRSLRDLAASLVLLALAAPTFAAAQQGARNPLPPVTAPAGQEIRFAADIQKFLDQDKTNPPPQGGIEFIGSSIFRQWETVPQDMAPLPAYNRAFGGSRTWEVSAYVDKIVLPYKPSIIVYYCGSNDIEAGNDQTAQDVFDHVKDFEARVHRALPQTRIYFFGIMRAMDQRNRWDVVDHANELIKQWAYRTPNFDYVESNTVLFDAKDEPIAAFYKPDGRHYNPPAYAAFTTVLKPVLMKAWTDMGKSTTQNQN